MRSVLRRFAAIFLSLALLMLSSLFGALAEESQGADDPATDAETAQSDADTDALSQDESISIDDKLAQVFRRFSTMGASVAVIQNGKITYTYCYGTRRNGNTAVTPDTCFQVGSISKMVANIGLMQLVEQGEAELENELGDLLGFPIRNPSYPNTPVTLRNLMTHTAGLRGGKYYTEALAGDVRPLDELFDNRRAQHTFMQETEAGTRYEYCNFGGGLIGSLIERLSGQNVDEYLAQNVFEPLGITAAYQPALINEDAPVADMYYMPEKRLAKLLRDADTAVTEPDYLRHYTFTAGKLIISAPDLAKLVIALCDGGVYEDTRILKESSVAEMTTVQNHRGSVSCEANCGLFMNIIKDNQVEGRTMYGHGGKANGMLCAAYFDPTDRTGVVMLTNGCYNKSSHNGVGMLGRAVMRVIYQDMLAGTHEVEEMYLVEE